MDCELFLESNLSSKSLAETIQKISNTFYPGLEYSFKVIGEIMKKIDGNLLFLENGSDQLLRKENGQLIVNDDLNQYQKRYLTKNLLGLLGHSYIEGTLPK